MAKLVSVDCNTFGIRKIYVEATEKDLAFVKGARVLPARHFEENDNFYFEYVTKHEPGEKGWKDGGYEVIEFDRKNVKNDTLAKRRAFHLDELIVYPRNVKKMRLELRESGSISQ